MQDEEIFIIDKVEEFVEEKASSRKGLPIFERTILYVYHGNYSMNITYCIMSLYIPRFTIFHLSFFSHLKRIYKL